MQIIQNFIIPLFTLHQLCSYRTISNIVCFIFVYRTTYFIPTRTLSRVSFRTTFSWLFIILTCRNWRYDRINLSEWNSGWIHVPMIFVIIPYFWVLKYLPNQIRNLIYASNRFLPCLSLRILLVAFYGIVWSTSSFFLITN